MSGVLERALGEDWNDLHRKVRERYGLSTDGEVHTVVGRGTMDRDPFSEADDDAIATHTVTLSPPFDAVRPFPLTSGIEFPARPHA